MSLNRQQFSTYQKSKLKHCHTVYGNGPCESFLPKQQAVCIHSEEIDPFECEISEEDMAQEDVSHLIIDNDDEIINVET